jgi:hypothetical protein
MAPVSASQNAHACDTPRSSGTMSPAGGFEACGRRGPIDPCLRALALLRQLQGLRGRHSLGELLLALYLGIELGAKEQRDVR